MCVECEIQALFRHITDRLDDGAEPEDIAAAVNSLILVMDEEGLVAGSKAFH